MYQPPKEFMYNGRRLFVYSTFTDYALCSKGRPDQLRVIKVPTPKNAFVVYGDGADELANELSSKILSHSRYYAAPIRVLV